MKTKKLTLLLTAAMFLMGGHNAVKADTTLLTEAGGWQKITSISQSDIEKYYYVFVDKDNDLMLGLAKGVNNTKRNAMFYQKGADVVKDKSKLWAIEKNWNNYALRNAFVDNYLRMQTEWGDGNPSWDTNDQSNECEWTDVKLEYDKADAAWSIISTKNTRALGVYGDSEKVPAENDEIGANSNGKGQKFLIYAIRRSDYYAKLTEGASKDNPKDLSWAIKNNTLDDNRKDKLQSEGGWNLACNGGRNFNNDYGVGEFYSWVDQPNFELSQTLTGLQPGTYQLSAQLFENAKKDVYLFGNTTKVCVEQTDYSAGTGGSDMEKVANLMKADRNYGKVTVSVLVDENGTLELGLCGNCPATTWVVFDNFQLQYMGNEKEDICKIKYQEVQDKAKELLYNPVYAQIQGKDKVDLETLADEDANTVINVDNYETKKQALETAMTTFQEDKEVYNTFVSHVENANLFGKEALGLTEIPTADKASDASITGEELRELRSQMYEAEYNYVKKTYTSDITSLKGINGWNGWTKPELAADNWQSYAGDHQDPKYYEVSGGFFNTGKWEHNLSRSITLYPGKYVVKLACRTSSNGGSGYVSVKVGDTEPKANFPLKNDTGYGITTTGEASFDGSKVYNSTGRQGGGWEWRYVPFELKSTSEVTLTIHVASEGGNNYPGFYEPQLLAMPPMDVTLKDTETYGEVPALVANVTLNRKLGEKWNTIVLPFALNEAQVTEMFGEGVKVAAYTGSTVNGDHVTLNFKEQTSMEAQTPYMIKPGTSANSYKVNGVILEPASGLKKVEDANHNGIDFVGNYTTGQTLQQNSFFISNNVFYRASGQETMKAYRATFQVPSSLSAAKSMNTVFVGEGGSVTAIDDVHVSPQGSFDVYHINGMLVKKNAIDLNGLDKGIYIINGKKYVVK